MRYLAPLAIGIMFALATFGVRAESSVQLKKAGPGSNEKLIPAEKKLDPAWVQALYARGEKEVFQGKDLDTIGMPCGGIGAGQLYLCGDGTLGSWMIFNNAVSPFLKDSTYGIPFEKGLVDQGFALALRKADGSTLTRKLNRAGFADVRFRANTNRHGSIHRARFARQG